MHVGDVFVPPPYRELVRPPGKGRNEAEVVAYTHALGDANLAAGRRQLGLGVSWDGTGPAGERTFTARGEYYDGDVRSGYRFEAQGDVTVRSTSHFVGSSLEHHVRGRVWGRLDSRLLHVATTDDSRWSVAPAAVVDLGQIEVEGGYRFGNLQDIDFSGRGGLGFFASIGVRLTEASVRSAAGVWRGRIGEWLR